MENSPPGDNVRWLPAGAPVPTQLVASPGSDQYWARIGDRLVVADSPWPVARLIGCVRPNRSAFADMLHSPLLPSDSSVSALQGVSRFSQHEAQLAQHFEMSQQLTLGDLTYGLDKRLRAAVRSQLAPHAKVAVLVTGGLDSSVVAAITREVTETPPILIAVRGGLSSPVECSLQDIVARSIGSKLVVLDQIPPFRLDALVRLNRNADFPVGGVFSHVWDAALDLASAAGADVVLTGEGGNELFSPGAAAAADQVRLGRIVPTLSAIGRSRPSDGTSVSRSMIRSLRGDLMDESQQRTLPSAVAQWLGGYAQCTSEVSRRRRRQIRQLRRRGLSYTAIAAHVWLERIDLYAARSSRDVIPVHSPLADDARVWSYLARAPVRLLGDLIPGNQDKYLLRLVGRRYLPATITETRKVGLPNQIATILRTADRDEVHSLRSGAEWAGLRLDGAYDRPSDLPAECGLVWTRTLAMSAWGLNAG